MYSKTLWSLQHLCMSEQMMNQAYVNSQCLAQAAGHRLRLAGSLTTNEVRQSVYELFGAC